MRKKFTPLLVLPFLLLAPLAAAGGRPETVTVPLTRPGKPCLINLSLINGSITVTGSDQSGILIEAQSEGQAPPETGTGRRTIPRNTLGLKVTEEDNIVQIHTREINLTINFVLRVPRQSSLKLRTVNDGDIRVEGVEGELDLSNVNGSIDALRISGSLAANTVNGHLTVSFDKLDGSRPLHLTTLNGDIELSVPAGFAARAELITTHGDISSDFEIVPEANTVRMAENKPGQRTRYRVVKDRTLTGRIQGGELKTTLKTFNGDIRLKKTG